MGDVVEVIGVGFCTVPCHGGSPVRCLFADSKTMEYLAGVAIATCLAANSFTRCTGAPCSRILSFFLLELRGRMLTHSSMVSYREVAMASLFQCGFSEYFDDNLRWY